MSHNSLFSSSFPFFFNFYFLSNFTNSFPTISTLSFLFFFFLVCPLFTPILSSLAFASHYFLFVLITSILHLEILLFSLAFIIHRVSLEWFPLITIYTPNSNTPPFPKFSSCFYFFCIFSFFPLDSLFFNVSIIQFFLSFLFFLLFYTFSFQQLLFSYKLRFNDTYTFSCIIETCL